MNPTDSDPDNFSQTSFSPVDAFALAVRRFEAGNIVGALAICDQLIALDPTQTELWQLSGLASFALNQFADAARKFEQAVMLDPANAAHRINLANAFIKLDRDAEAETSFENARRLAPGVAEIDIGLGTLARRAGDLDGAIRYADRALALASQSYQALVNRGRALHELERFADAIESYNSAIAVDPRAFPAHVAKAISLFIQGDLVAGAREYEWRGEGRERDWRTRFSQPEWLGEPLAGATVLVHAEQGFGDTIQFTRFVPQVAARGIHVTAEVQPVLKNVIAAMLPGIDVRARGDALPPFDRHIRLMSLPYVLGTPLEAIPSPLKFESMRPAWLPPEKKLLTVGLSWAGNPTHENDRYRSIAPDLLAPLAELDGVRFVSVQRPIPGREADLPFSAIDAGERISDFCDLAQILSGLDLLVTVDSAPAHLMGAMGLPVWILLPRPPDWRWLVNREDSPWYSSARLFRQSHRGDWSDVVARVALALKSRRDENGGMF